MLELIIILNNNISIEANSLDPDPTCTTGAVWYRSILFAQEASKHFSRRQNRRFLIAALKVKTIFNVPTLGHYRTEMFP